MIPRIALTPGEPAGIGPDIVLAAALEDWEAELVAVGDPELLRERAQVLGLTVQLRKFDPEQPAASHQPGTLKVLPVHVTSPSRPGHLDPANARYVLATLHAARDGCQPGDFAAMVTGPVQKSVINDAGIPFSGHTELLAEATGAAAVVMMLAAGDLRVALATTHLPLREVADAITRDGLEQTLRILHRDLREKFGIADPRINVLGLNPHAGEGGHLGREEIDIITPLLEQLRRDGMDLRGPLPADTAFNPRHLADCDTVCAMYHDQGLPVIKHAGFGEAVNITLGLPILRTSVDHGTALELAASGRAEHGSLAAALGLAIAMANSRS